MQVNIYVVNMIPLNPRINTAQPFASPPSHVSSFGLSLIKLTML